MGTKDKKISDILERTKFSENVEFSLEKNAFLKNEIKV